MYNISNTITSDEMRQFRKKLEMTQSEFAEFIGVSTSSVERMEKKGNVIKGPEAMLVIALRANSEWLDSQRIPEKQLPIRLFYMHENSCCSIIDVDDVNQKVIVTNFVTNIFFKAFGENVNPTYHEYQEFLKSRCFPET